MQTTLVTEFSENKDLKPALKEGNRILVLRTASRVLSPVLRQLKQEFPDCHLTVMAPLNCHESLKQDPNIDEILIAPQSGRWSLTNPGPHGIDVLKNRNFDLAVALYNEAQGQGYSNIDLLASATNAKEVRGYTPDLNFTLITPETIRKKKIQERSARSWLIANSATSAVLMVIVTMALMCEGLIRKLRSLWRAS